MRAKQFLPPEAGPGTVRFPVAGLLAILLVFFPAREHVCRGQVPEAVSPNIVLINLDDADWSLLERDFAPGATYRYFPNLARLGLEGQRYVNCHVSTPICAPSRASLLTGQYAHLHGLRVNEPDMPSGRGLPGGYDVFRENGPFGPAGPRWIDNHLGTWMQGGGYRTMLVGKYLHNGFVPLPGQSWAPLRPPGWDESYVSLGAHYFRTSQLVNGVVRNTSSLNAQAYPSRYRTDVESSDALRLISQHLGSNPEQPFFLYFAPFAPHRESEDQLSVDESLAEGGMAPPRYRGWWPNMVQPLNADFNEWDTSDKPVEIRQLPLLNLQGATWRENELLLADAEFRRRMLSLRAVDDFARELLTLLDQNQQTNRTVVILTSDNGYQLGQQRAFGKGLPYDRLTRVPLLVWGPGRVLPRPEPLRYLLSQVDLTPTILELAGVVPPVPMSGRSIVPLLRGEYSGLFRDWRPEGVLIEHWQNIARNSRTIRSTWNGVRMFDSVFVEWATGEEEYYDLTVDPFQLENTAPLLAPARRNELRELVTFHKLRLSRPLSHIETPFQSEQVFLRTADFTGTAEYARDIREVRLVIRELDPGPGRFWNGSAWQDGFAFVPARLEGDGLTLVNWTYPFRAPSTEQRRVLVTSRAFGEDGNFQAVPDTAVALIEPDQPVGQIVRPLPDQLVRGGGDIALEISGRAADSRGLKAVRLVIRDQATDQFWDGQQWVANAVTLPVRGSFNPLGTAISWTFAFRPPETSGAAIVTMRMVSQAPGNPVRTHSRRIRWLR